MFPIELNFQRSKFSHGIQKMIFRTMLKSRVQRRKIKFSKSFKNKTSFERAHWNWWQVLSTKNISENSLKPSVALLSVSISKMLHIYVCCIFMCGINFRQQFGICQFESSKFIWQKPQNITCSRILVVSISLRTVVALPSQTV